MPSVSGLRWRVAHETRKVGRRVSDDMSYARAWIFGRRTPGIKQLTMVTPEGIARIVRFTDRVVDDGLDGAAVECGTWRGGASFTIARRLEHRRDGERTVWMFDSFEGLPPPGDLDGDSAQRWADDTTSPRYFDNCSASLEEVEAAATRLGLRHRVRPVKGWFDETLPARKAEIGPVALLRIDADWYASVKTCLVELYDQVVEGGFVLIDDYDAWEGCALAVHEFLAERQLAHRLERDGSAVYFRKH